MIKLTNDHSIEKSYSFVEQFHFKLRNDSKNLEHTKRLFSFAKGSKT